MAAPASGVARMAQVFHALSDPTRLEILTRLRGGEQCVCELMDELDAAQSRLSFHLKVLREAGVVDCRREGRWAYYWLNTEALDELDAAVRALKPSRALRVVGKAGCCP